MQYSMHACTMIRISLITKTMVQLLRCTYEMKTLIATVPNHDKIRDYIHFSYYPRIDIHIKEGGLTVNQ